MSAHSSPIYQAVSTSSSDVAELSLSSELLSFGQSGPTSPADPGFLMMVASAGQSVPECSFRSVPANQDYCHQCLLNRVGITSGVPERS